LSDIVAMWRTSSNVNGVQDI